MQKCKEIIHVQQKCGEHHILVKLVMGQWHLTFLFMQIETRQNQGKLQNR